MKCVMHIELNRPYFKFPARLKIHRKKEYACVKFLPEGFTPTLPAKVFQLHESPVFKYYQRNYYLAALSFSVISMNSSAATA